MIGGWPIGVSSLLSHSMRLGSIVFVKFEDNFVSFMGIVPLVVFGLWDWN